MQANNNDFVCVRQASLQSFLEDFFGRPTGFLAAASFFISDADKNRMKPLCVPMPWSMHSLRTRESLIPSSAAASWTVFVMWFFIDSSFYTPLFELSSVNNGSMTTLQSQTSGFGFCGCIEILDWLQTTPGRDGPPGGGGMKSPCGINVHSRVGQPISIPLAIGRPSGPI